MTPGYVERECVCCGCPCDWPEWAYWQRVAPRCDRCRMECRTPQRGKPTDCGKPTPFFAQGSATPAQHNAAPTR